MKTPKKCLVSHTIPSAQNRIAAIGLTEYEWEPRAYFDDLGGERWTTIVVIQPPDGWTLHHHNWIAVCLKNATDNLVLL